MPRRRQTGEHRTRLAGPGLKDTGVFKEMPPTEDDEIDAYLGTLHVSVQARFRSKPRSRLLKEARKAAKNAITAPEPEHVDAAPPPAPELSGVKKRKRRAPLPSPRTSPLPVLPASGTATTNKRAGCSLMSKEQRRLHEQAAAHFAAATKQLDSVGAGELRLLWKKRMGHGCSMQMMPYKHTQTASEVMNCRDLEKGVPSTTTTPTRPLPSLPSDTFQQIEGLRYN